MPRDGSGTANRAVSSYVFDTTIDEVAVNAEMDDIYDELTRSLAKDGQTTPTANIPMGGFKLTGAGAGSARTDSVNLGQVQDGKLYWVAAGGTADAITAAYSPAITALVDGQLCYVRAGDANATTTPSFSPNGLTARTIVKNGGAALVAGDIVGDGHELILRYDLANTRWELLNPKGGGTAATTDAAGIVELATNAETQTGSDTARAVTPAALTAAAVKQGKHTIWVPAAAMRPTVSNGCAPLAAVETTAGRPDLMVLDFDASSDEHAQFSIAMPKSWNEGTVTFQAYWTTTATDTDGVAWGLQAVACGNSDTIDVAYGTAVVVTDDNDSAAEDCMVTAESSAITIAGTPAAEDIVFFRVFRDVSDANDDMTEDARLIGLKVYITTDAATDA